MRLVELVQQHQYEGNLQVGFRFGLGPHLYTVEEVKQDQEWEPGLIIMLRHQGGARHTFGVSKAAWKE